MSETTQETADTRTPWSVELRDVVVNDSGEFLFFAGNGIRAAHIVKCVNAYPALVDVCEDLWEFAESFDPKLRELAARAAAALKAGA